MSLEKSWLFSCSVTFGVLEQILEGSVGFDLELGENGRENSRCKGMTCVGLS